MARRVLPLGGPDGGLAPEPGGLVEVRVVSGPGAGSIYWLVPHLTNC
jgi:hypothetical protein